MSQQSRTTLKSYFETGDIPTQSNFEDLIDSSPNITDEASTKWTVYRIYNDGYVPENNWVSYGSGGETWSYTITHNIGNTNFLPSFKAGLHFDTSPYSQEWDVLDFQGLRDYIMNTHEPITLSSVLVNDTTITFVVTGTLTKPNIVFGLRLLKV